MGMTSWVIRAVLVLSALSSACARDAGVATAAPQTREPAPSPAAISKAAPVQIAMQHVRLHVADGIVLDVTSLRGEMISRTSGPPVFDDGPGLLQAAEEQGLEGVVAKLEGERYGGATWRKVKTASWR